MKRAKVLIIIGLCLGAAVGLCLVAASLLKGPEDDRKPLIKAEAQKCADALRREDFEEFASYTHPFVVEKMGGKDAMIERLRQGTAEMKQQGQSFLSMEIGDPATVTTVKGVVYALVPETITIKISGGKLVARSHLLAVSRGGNAYCFVDTASLNEYNLGLIFPDLSGNFTLPEKRKPDFVPDGE